MNFNCKNCGWSEIIGSSIICHYTEHKTWCDECCEAWKSKGTPSMTKQDVINALEMVKESNAFEKNGQTIITLDVRFVEIILAVLKDEQVFTQCGVPMYITQHYHCNCTHCGKDWWTDDAFPSICPFCHKKLI